MIFLTGASGYIGGHVLRRLLAHGARVRCLLLSNESLDGVAGRVEIVRGDVTQLESFRAAGDGVETVIHCAAALLPNAADRIQRVNVEGTRNVLRFAQRGGLRQFVYFSAVSAVYRQRNVSGESKAAAEALVTASGLPYTILRPTMVYGDGGGLHFRQLVRLVRRAPGALPILGNGQARLQPVSIDAVVGAVELVLEHPAAACQTYGVAGASVVTFDEYIDLLSRLLGRPRPLKLHVPLALCTAAGRVIESLAGPGFYSPAALRGINEDATLDTRPFEIDCGYKPSPLEDGLRAALRVA